MSALNWETPYPSNRSPVFANNMVATSQPLATQAGIQAMQQGGNAVDAAIAAAITLTVVEPNNNGIGSDAFAILWDGAELHGLNASGKSPAAWSPEHFAKYKTMPSLGWDAVTVPGAVSAWMALSNKFGQLPFTQLFESGIHYAEQGFQVGPKSGFFWQLAENRYRNYPDFLQTFMKDGAAPAIGEVMQLPDHGQTLRSIAASQGEAFYRGGLAKAMVADSDKHGGCLSLEDLSSHQPEWVGTISEQLGDAELHEIPPNGQGLMALIALGIAKHLDLKRFEPDSADAIHLEVECMRLAFVEVERHLADIRFMDRVTVQALLDPDYLRARAQTIDPVSAHPHPTALGASADTVYLTTADAGGMMVSLIQSNYRGFGSGIVVPGTGVSLQNRGNGFTLEAGHPNQVAGGKRPFHTIIPGFIMQNGQPSLGFGVMGGHMQAQGHLQMLLRIYLWGQNPQAASDAPRWHLGEDGKLSLESGTPLDVIDDLRSRGHELDLHAHESLFGGAQLIYRMSQGYCAGSDHRKEGLAAGF
ncbi:MAG: gamma-glutamyltranspeptidase/glutathione hydrolase [Candidatus Azotimanducaceae bacterium]|jgi:gamma-glutamyltranspeptidase/glutathione hydrolase